MNSDTSSCLRRLYVTFLRKNDHGTLNERALKVIDKKIAICIIRSNILDTTFVDFVPHWGQKGSQLIAANFIFPVLHNVFGLEQTQQSHVFNSLFDMPNVKSAFYAILHYNTSTRKELTAFQQKWPQLQILLRENQPADTSRPGLSKCNNCSKRYRLQPPLLPKRQRENEEEEEDDDGRTDSEDDNNASSYIHREYVEDGAVYIADDAETSSSDSSGFEHLDDD